MYLTSVKKLYINFLLAGAEHKYSSFIDISTSFANELSTCTQIVCDTIFSPVYTNLGISLGNTDYIPQSESALSIKPLSDNESQIKNINKIFDIQTSSTDESQNLKLNDDDPNKDLHTPNESVKEQLTALSQQLNLQLSKMHPDTSADSSSNNNANNSKNIHNTAQKNVIINTKHKNIPQPPPIVNLCSENAKSNTIEKSKSSSKKKVYSRNFGADFEKLSFDDKIYLSAKVKLRNTPKKTHITSTPVLKNKKKHINQFSTPVSTKNNSKTIHKYSKVSSASKSIFMQIK